MYVFSPFLSQHDGQCSILMLLKISQSWIGAKQEKQILFRNIVIGGRGLRIELGPIPNTVFGKGEFIAKSGVGVHWWIENY